MSWIGKSADLQNVDHELKQYDNCQNCSYCWETKAILAKTPSF